MLGICWELQSNFELLEFKHSILIKIYTINHKPFVKFNLQYIPPTISQFWGTKSEGRGLKLNNLPWYDRRKSN